MTLRLQTGGGGGGGGTAAPPRQVGAIGTNLGATQTVTFSGAEEVWLVGTLNANLAVTTASRVQGAILGVLALQNGTGNFTLTIDTQPVAIPGTPTTGVSVAIVRYTDTTTANAVIETNGVESDPLAVLKSLGTTKGDIIAWTASATPARLPVGADGQVLTGDAASAGGVKWANAASGFANPMTTVGDLILGGTAGAAGRLAKGSNGQALTIDSTGAVVWGQGSNVLANTQTASYTLVLADAGLSIEMNSASATVLTVPPNSSVAFPTGTVIEVCRLGAGAVTIAQGASVVIRNRLEAAGTTNRTLVSQYSSASLRKRGTDEWVLVGDIA